MLRTCEEKLVFSEKKKSNLTTLSMKPNAFNMSKNLIYSICAHLVLTYYLLNVPWTAATLSLKVATSACAGLSFGHPVPVGQRGAVWDRFRLFSTDPDSDECYDKIRLPFNFFVWNKISNINLTIIYIKEGTMLASMGYTWRRTLLSETYKKWCLGCTKSWTTGKWH